jgi:hypothetical protein
MNTRIITENTPEDWPTFEVTNAAVIQLWQHGWEPPAVQSYDITTPDGGRLIIPQRTRQRTAPPTHAEIALTINARIQARMLLAGSTADDVVDALTKGVMDAAEAIQDLYGDTQ